MRLTRKLTLALAVGVIAVLLIAGIFRVRREVQAFRSDMVFDHHAVSTALASAAAEVWRLDGIREARDVIAHSSPAGTALRARWVTTAETNRNPALADAARLALSQAGPVDVVDDADGLLVTYAPVFGPRSQNALVELSESLNLEQRYIRNAVLSAIITTGAIAVVTATIAFLLGTAIVGRPTRALMNKARRVGLGDLSSPLVLPQRDELGQLAIEMNAMCEELSRARDRAESEMQTRIQVLEQLRHADRLATVGKLASGIAHELGTPLNVVYGRARMLETGEVEGDTARDCARIVREQTQKMSAIIRQLLDFARQKATPKSPRDVRELTRAVVHMLAPLAAKSQVELTLDPSDEPALAEVGSNQLEQALSNLVVNAIHVSPPGAAVHLHVDTVDALLPQSGAERERFVRVAVSDSGPGMTDAVAKRVFEPFFTTKEVGQGTGLGLSVAYGIARDHGGFIDVDTRVGRGTTFVLHVRAA